MALPTRQLYFEGVKVGDELPPLVKPPVDRIQIARFAGASQDYNPLYVDEQFARNSGFPSALAPAMLAMGFLGELVVDWLRGARMRKFSARFVKIVWPGDVITCRGRVVDRRFEEPGRYGVDIEAWAENQRGELVVRGLVAAQPYYNAEDEARQRAGQPPLVVTAQEEEARLARLTRGLPPRRPEAAQRAGAVPSRPAPAPAKKAAPSRPARPAKKAAPAKRAGPPRKAKAMKPARVRKAAGARKPARVRRPTRVRRPARVGRPARVARPARVRKAARVRRPAGVRKAAGSAGARRKPSARPRPRSAKRR